MSKYTATTDIVFKLTNNKSIANNIMPFVIGEKPCTYLKNVVHYCILNELQTFVYSCYKPYQYIRYIKWKIVYKFYNWTIKTYNCIFIEIIGC